MDKKKILVVEDEKAISDILVFNLQREGYDTLAAYDGAEGLRCALEEAPDLILLDVMLPEMDGFEVCRRVRAEKDTPIIMLTAREEETDKVMGLELGADDYITKPFSMRELMARVKDDIDRIWNALGYVGMLMMEVAFHVTVILFCMYSLNWKLAILPLSLIHI